MRRASPIRRLVQRLTPGGVRSCRHPVAFAAMLVALFAWVADLGATSLHEGAVLHVECAEHHEVEDVATDSSHATGPGIWSLAPAAHHHGCDLVNGATAAHGHSRPALPRPLESADRVVQRVLLAAPPRAPPLDYAPKTSPPLG